MVLDTYRQAVEQEWDFRDEHNRPIQDPALREAMARAETEAAFQEAFSKDDHTTSTLMEWVGRTLGRFHWSDPAEPQTAPAPVATARRATPTPDRRTHLRKADAVPKPAPAQEAAPARDGPAPPTRVLRC